MLISKKFRCNHRRYIYWKALGWIWTSDLCHTKAMLFLTELPRHYYYHYKVIINLYILKDINDFLKKKIFYEAYWTTLKSEWLAIKTIIINTYQTLLRHISESLFMVNCSFIKSNKIHLNIKKYLIYTRIIIWL